MTKFKVNVPKHFNFAFDVMDELARTKPQKTALLWTNDKGGEKSFTFADMKRLSDQAANYFLSAGIKRGDRVMLILKRHYTFWYAMMALCKIGAIAIPATHLLTKKDVVYRCQSADIKMIVATGEGDTAEHVEEALHDCPMVKRKAMLGQREGWDNFEAEVEKQSATLGKVEQTNNDDIMLLYFTSGTSGMPKMVAHSFTYPLGHIITAVYWHNVQPDGLHLTSQTPDGAKRCGASFTGSGWQRRRCSSMTTTSSCRTRCLK